jgi:hypothetical protein
MICFASMTGWSSLDANSCNHDEPRLMACRVVA